ncbi:MAG: hypothetical protein GX265_04750 [Mollicutes bacterium]|nr:hypothetical protein [Mollicutes bacterium]
MNSSFAQLIKINLGILLLHYGEKYFFSFLPWIGITSSLSTLTNEILTVVYYLIVLIITLYMYREDLTDLRRFKRNLFPNTLMSIVFFVILTLIIFITNYIGEYLAELLKVSYRGVQTYNVFTKSIDIYWILELLKNIFIIPITQVIVYVLGISNLIYSKKKAILFSGLVAACIASAQMTGSYSEIIINAIPYFVIYFALSYIYRKNNTNICYSIMTFVLFNLFSSMLLSKLLGG